MIIYIAGRYESLDMLQGWATYLVEDGHGISSRWLSGAHDFAVDSAGQKIRAGGEEARWAAEDMEDVCRAEVLLVFSPKNHFCTGRGGRHVEVGLALGLGKRILLVGERENVFHHLPQIEQYDSFNAARAALKGEGSPR